MVGASGALYGVLVGFVMLFPNAQLMLLFPPIPVKAKFLVPILILADLFFGFSSYSIGPIAHFAHVGGAMTGLVMMWYWKKKISITIVGIYEFFYNLKYRFGTFSIAEKIILINVVFFLFPMF